MTFPTIAVQGVSTDNTADTSGTGNLPSGTYTTGDTIIFGTAGRDNITTSGWSTGWNEFIDAAGPAADGSVHCAWRESDGTESGGTVTFTTSAATKHPGYTYVINGADDPDTTPPEGSTFGQTGGAPNPPSHTVSWATGEDNMCLVFVGHKAAVTATAYPTTPATATDTFTNATDGGGGACSISGCAFYDTARDTIDPGTFTMTASNDNTAATIMVRPSAGGGPTGRIMSSLVGYGGLAGHGGIAGIGGGLGG